MSGTTPHEPLREFYEPRHPAFAVWDPQPAFPRRVRATPPIPLTIKHQLLPLFVQRVGSRLFVLALAPDPGVVGRVAETRAIEARDYAAQNLVRDGLIFYHGVPDY